VLEAAAAGKSTSVAGFSDAASRVGKRMNEIYRVPVLKAQLKAIPSTRETYCCSPAMP
jgi:hypothetical protein